MKSLYTKFCEFTMHIKGEMNLSLFSFSEFCTLEEQELGGIYYIKDVVLYEGILTKFISYFSQLYFIFYKSSNFRNVYMYR
jgi:hypothetical protein